MNFAEKLQALRKAAGMSQEQLADRLEVSRQAVSKWELGDAAPDADKIVKLAALFGVTTDYLLVETAEQPRAAGTSAAVQPESALHGIAGFIKRKGYIAGYIIAGYAAAIFLMTRLAHMMFSRMIPEGFEDAGQAVAVPLLFTNVVGIAALAIAAGGLILAAVLKKRSKKR